jgi:hypothetical protein
MDTLKRTIDAQYLVKHTAGIDKMHQRSVAVMSNGCDEPARRSQTAAAQQSGLRAHRQELVGDTSSQRRGVGRVL